MKTFFALIAVATLLAPLASSTCNVTVLVKIGAGSYLLPGELCPVSVPEGSNGSVVLDAAQAAGCITSWDYETFPDFGRFVTCIDDVCDHDVGDFVPELQGQDGTYWEFSVNLHTTSYGIDAYSAQDLDVFGFTYQDWFLGFADFTVSQNLP